MSISKMSLLYFASRKVYYECVNVILNLEKGEHWYCTCDNLIAVQNKIVSSTIAMFEGQGNTNVKKILN